MKHYVEVSGCDDSTSVVIELTKAQADGVRLVADAITAAGGGCMPVMSTRPASTREIEESK